MPAALDVNWEEVKMLAVSIGIREAARKLGLGESAVMQRSAREGWIRDLPRSSPLPVTMLKPVSDVSSPSIIQRNIIIEKVLQTRENHVDVALRASNKLKELPDALLIDHEQAQTTLAIAKHAALTAGWNADSRPDSPGKAFGGRNSGLEIDVETLECEPAEPIAEVEAGPSTDVNDY